MTIFLIIPFSPEFEDIYQAVRQAVDEANHTLIRADELSGTGHITSQIRDTIKTADIIIADVTNANPNVMYEFGFAQSLEKPVITICQKGEPIPFDLNRRPILLYDRLRLGETLTRHLRSYFFTQNWEQFVYTDKATSTKQRIAKTVFVSYSHADVQYLNRLKIHMRPFEKSGHIDLWADTKIKVGEKWKEKISNALDKAAIAILLISADFLASDFVVDNELPPLLKAAEEKGTLILPVIVKPCRFTKDRNLSQFQAVNDPTNPLSRMDESDKEDVYVKVADYIDSLIED
jgi:hypothetical protein